MYPGLGEAPITQNQQTGAQFYDEPAAQSFDIVLTANQSLTDLSLYFDRDSDFYVTALAGTKTGNYTIKLTLPGNRAMSSAPIQDRNLIGTAQFPVAMFPALRVPAGGKIGIEIKDTSGSGNTIQIVFIGMRRYQV